MKKISYKITAFLLSALLAVPANALTVIADNTRTYSGEFTDVSESAWYYDYVVDAYSLGLINGKTETTFAPDQTLTIAETIKLAALTHQILKNGTVNEAAFESANSSHWYDGYVSYCIANGIVTEEYENYNIAASRAQVSILFSRSVISSGVDIKEINSLAFGDLSDVDSSMWYAGAVYRMVRWGILSGDANGNIKPESSVKRSEISAILMRILDENERVLLGGAKVDSDSSDKKADQSGDATNVDANSGVTGSSVTLYEGSRDKKSFTGITGFAGEFTVENGVSTTDAGYSLDLINSLVLEEDNVSFRLYTGSGYEALGIVRGWLNESARGKDGASLHEKNDVFEAVNELCYIWVGNERVVISELWYADHGEYTTYAMYFEDEIDLKKADSVSISVGRLERSTLEGADMESLADRIEKADKEGVISPDTNIPVSDNYTVAIADAKENAAKILFEYECERCDILYGRGLYGRESDSYRLLFIYKNGTVQTVATSELDDIRINSAGNVLYYSVTAPDGKVLQYGINFGD